MTEMERAGEALGRRSFQVNRLLTSVFGWRSKGQSARTFALTISIGLACGLTSGCAKPCPYERFFFQFKGQDFEIAMAVPDTLFLNGHTECTPEGLPVDSYYQAVTQFVRKRVLGTESNVVIVPVQYVPGGGMPKQLAAPNQLSIGMDARSLRSAVLVQGPEGLDVYCVSRLPGLLVVDLFSASRS